MSEPKQKLRSNALGLLATAALTAAYMGPALSIYGLFKPMSDQVGGATGFVMLLGLLLTLPSALSFGLLAREMPSAGGVYAWTRKALGESAGLWVGLVTASYYTLTIVFPPLIFGQFFNELAQQLGLPATNATWLLGAFVMLGIAASVTYRGIVVSAELAFAMVVIETVVVMALAGTFLWKAVATHTFTWQPFLPSGAYDPAGKVDPWTAIYLALPMALLSMVCDAVTPAAEETRNARWTIPAAVVLTCILVGVWYVVGFSAFTMAPPPEGAAALAPPAANLSPVTPMAGRVWGQLKILVSITGMTACLGAFIPAANAASRVLFAMSRDGVLPAGLARLHPRFLAPWSAMHVVYAVSIFGGIPAGLLCAVEDTITWWTDAFGWFVAVVYVAANLANIVWFRRFCADRFHGAWNLLVPVLGIVAQLVVCWQATIVGLWRKGWAGWSVQIFVGVHTAATLAYVVRLRMRGPQPAPVAVPAGDE